LSCIYDVCLRARRDIWPYRLRETAVAATRAEFVVTGNPGCLMQIGAGLRRSGSAATTIHPVELLDASYAARR
jgi:Fe-S oxidoreductase